MTQPKEHPLRVGGPQASILEATAAKLKAEWPGAKVATNVDIILPYILLADTPRNEERIGDGIYWILHEVMDIPIPEMTAAFARVYAAQTEQVKKRKVAFFGEFLFPYLADERVLAPLKDMLDDATVYKVVKWGEPTRKRYVTARRYTFSVIHGYLYREDLLRSGFPEGQYLMDAAVFNGLEINGDDSNEAEQCAFLKNWLTTHWAEVAAKCAEIRAKPDREYRGPSSNRRILTPLTPEPNRY